MIAEVAAPLDPAVRLRRSNVLLELSAAKLSCCPESLKRRSCTLTSGKSGRFSVYGMPAEALLLLAPVFETGRSDVADDFCWLSFSIVWFSS